MTKQEEIISLAKKLVGTPYKYGAKTEEAPNFFDCSGFVQYVFGENGIELPRSSILQACDEKGVEINGIENAQLGDLIFMRSDKGYYDDEVFGGRKLNIGHVGIYCGDGIMLHAKKSLGGVVIQKLSELQKDLNYEVQIIKRFI